MTATVSTTAQARIRVIYNQVSQYHVLIFDVLNVIVMDKKKDLSEFDKGEINMVSRQSQSISKMAGLGCLCSIFMNA